MLSENDLAIWIAYGTILVLTLLSLSFLERLDNSIPGHHHRKDSHEHRHLR